jgi:hypothetical protein
MHNLKRALVALTASAAVLTPLAVASPASASQGGSWQGTPKVSSEWGWHLHRHALNVKTINTAGPGCKITALSIAVRNYEKGPDGKKRIGDQHTDDLGNPGIIGQGSIVVTSYDGSRFKLKTGRYKVYKHNGILKRVFDVPDTKVDGINVIALSTKTPVDSWPDATTNPHMKRKC